MLNYRYSIQAVWKIVFVSSNTPFITTRSLGREAENKNVAVELLETCFLKLTILVHGFMS